jgi:hypothetical protein
MSFSPSEQKIYDILKGAKGKQLSTADLARRYYAKREMPEHGRVIITGIVRALVKKTARQPIKVKRTARSGPNPIMVWVE